MESVYKQRVKLLTCTFLCTVFIFIAFIIYNILSSDITVNIDKEIKPSSQVYYLSTIDMKTAKSNDFKEVSVNCEGNNILIRGYVSIKMDNLYRVFDNRNDIKIVEGNSFDYPEKMQHNESVILYCPEISKNDINYLLRDSKVEVKWQDIFGKKYKKIINLKDR